MSERYSKRATIPHQMPTLSKSWAKIQKTIKLAGKIVPPTSENEMLIDYSTEFENCITNGDDRALSDLMLKPGSTEHLEGFRLLRKEGNQRYTIVSTPLLDLVKKCPKVAGQVFYQMVTLNRSPSMSSISRFHPPEDSLGTFSDFEIGNLSKVRSLQFDYEFFDPGRIQKWHDENKKKYNLAPLSTKNVTKLNPLYWVMDRNISCLFHHVYITEYAFLKLRQYYTYYTLLFNLIFQM